MFFCYGQCVMVHKHWLRDYVIWSCQDGYCHMFLLVNTLSETNIGPENWWLEDEMSFWGCISFREFMGDKCERRTGGVFVNKSMQSACQKLAPSAKGHRNYFGNQSHRKVVECNPRNGDLNTTSTIPNLPFFSVLDSWTAIFPHKVLNGPCFFCFLFFFSGRCVCLFPLHKSRVDRTK